MSMCVYQTPEYIHISMYIQSTCVFIFQIHVAISIHEKLKLEYAYSKGPKQTIKQSRLFKSKNTF